MAGQPHTDEAVADLTRRLDPRSVLTDPGDCWTYGYDNSKKHGVPAAVVLPASHDDVARVVSVCHAHAVPLTVRGRGTGTTGAAVPIRGGVVMSTLGESLLEFAMGLPVAAGLLWCAAAGGRVTGILLATRPDVRGILFYRRQPGLQFCGPQGCQIRHSAREYPRAPSRRRHGRDDPYGVLYDQGRCRIRPHPPADRL